MVVENLENHKQTLAEEFNLEYVTRIISDKPSKVEAVQLDERKVVSRRCAMLLSREKKIINYGIGMPEVIAAVLNEEGQEEYFTPT